jgi:hypothetical protein
MGPREKLSLAKNEVPFLLDKESKVLEFWQIWIESIPARSELMPSTKVHFPEIFIPLHQEIV